MRRPRLVGFILVIVLGIVAGLIYGWVIDPAGVANTSLDSLRDDYKADYVLMVSESYASDGDLAKAIELLDAIHPSDPLAAVRDGLLTAQQMGYANNEMQFMAELEKALTLAVMGENRP